MDLYPLIAFAFGVAAVDSIVEAKRGKPDLRNPQAIPDRQHL